MITLKTIKSVMNAIFSNEIYFENKMVKNNIKTVVMVLILMAKIRFGEC